MNARSHKAFEPFTRKIDSWSEELIVSGVLLGFMELFRKFNSTEDYSEVEKHSIKLILNLEEDQNISLEVS